MLIKNNLVYTNFSKLTTCKSDRIDEEKYIYIKSDNDGYKIK